VATRRTPKTSLYGFRDAFGDYNGQKGCGEGLCGSDRSSSSRPGTRKKRGPERRCLDAAVSERQAISSSVDPRGARQEEEPRSAPPMRGEAGIYRHGAGVEILRMNY